MKRHLQWPLVAALGALVLLAAPGPAAAQDCTTCWNASCPEMKGYVPPCAGKGPRTTKGPKAGKASCTAGQVSVEGHCCWPGQSWANETCVGAPSSCPEGMTAHENACEPNECEGGKVRAPDSVHCCWKGQGYANNKCVGTPTECPAGTDPDAAKADCVQVDAVGLGTSDSALGPSDARRLGVAKAVKVEHVSPGTPAASAGLEAGDLLLELDGRPIEGAEGLEAALRAHSHDLVLLKLSHVRETKLSTMRVP